MDDSDYRLGAGTSTCVVPREDVVIRQSNFIAQKTQKSPFVSFLVSISTPLTLGVKRVI